MRRRYIPTLDGWRAVAITGVLLCHGLTLAKPVSRWERTLAPLILSVGQQGVALFFAISGYLITTLLLDEYQDGGAISLRAFYTRRVFRILPPAYTYLAVIGCLGALSLISIAPGEIAGGAFIYSNYWPRRSWFTQHFWSLSMEEHFYLIWPFILTRSGPRRAIWMAFAGILLTIAWRPIGLYAIPLSVTPLQRTDMRLDAFLAACLLALLTHNNGRVQKALGRPVLHACVTAILILGYAFFERRPMQLAKLTFQSCMLPLLVVPTAFMPHYVISRILEFKLIRWIGRISYSIYLWQQFILRGAETDYGSATVSLPFKIATILVLASASYYFIERPMIGKGRFLSERRDIGVEVAL
jgi:peptidoglycan/LPS O-acetylase OafA/YrhL